MSNDSILVGELAPADTNEHRITVGVMSKSAVIKADKANTSPILIGNSGNLKFPIYPGESLALSQFSGQEMFYKLGTGTDKLYFLAVEP